MKFHGFRLLQVLGKPKRFRGRYFAGALIDDFGELKPIKKPDYESGRFFQAFRYDQIITAAFKFRSLFPPCHEPLMHTAFICVSLKNDQTLGDIWPVIMTQDETDIDPGEIQVAAPATQAKQPEQIQACQDFADLIQIQASCSWTHSVPTYNEETTGLFSEMNDHDWLDITESTHLPFDSFIDNLPSVNQYQQLDEALEVHSCPDCLGFGHGCWVCNAEGARCAFEKHHTFQVVTAKERMLSTIENMNLHFQNDREFHLRNLDIANYID